MPTGGSEARVGRGQRADARGEYVAHEAAAGGDVLPLHRSHRAGEGEDHARLLNILECVSDVVGIIGPDNRLTYLNPAGRALLGIRDSEIVAGMRLPDLHPAWIAKKIESEALPAAVRDGVWTGESVVLTRSGREIAVSQVLIARRASDGSMDSLTTLMRDIRNRKRGEAALHQSEERFRTLVDTMNEGFVVMDRRGILMFVNDRFARMLDCAPSDVIGHPLLDFVDAARREAVFRQFETCAQNDRVVCEMLLARAGARQTSVRMTMKRIAAADAGVSGTCAVFSDLSTEAELARSLRQARHDLRCLSKHVMTVEENERKWIAADLHDGLGQSLSALKFGLENAAYELGADAVDEAMQTLQSLMPTVKDALEEVRRLSMNLRPSTLDDLGILATLSWFVREFQMIYRAISVQSDLRISEDEVPDALKVTMFRAVQEVMNNVAKHSRATLVRLSLERREGRLLLTIADNGVGFDPVDVASRDGCDRRHGHAGLEDRLEFSGGALSIDAAPGKGVCVRMSWPSVQSGTC